MKEELRIHINTIFERKSETWTYAKSKAIPVESPALAELDLWWPRGSLPELNWSSSPTVLRTVTGNEAIIVIDYVTYAEGTKETALFVFEPVEDRYYLTLFHETQIGWQLGRSLQEPPLSNK
ncbi:MAG: hypothetical protein QME81_08245 [bacterium]|nr:hypothetical protein [bacterium]